MKRHGKRRNDVYSNAAKTISHVLKTKRKKKHKGGALPLAAAIPAFIAAGKAISTGALSAAAGHLMVKALKKIRTKKSSKRKAKPN